MVLQVIDQDGDTVVLNTGSFKKATASFSLPLDGPVRTLELLPQYCTIPNWIPHGTIQAYFTYKTYNEVHRLGLKI